MRAITKGAALATWIVFLLPGCDRTKEIHQQADARAAEHKQRAEDRYRQLEQRLERDLDQIADILRDLPYERGKDVSGDPRLAKAAKVVDGLAEALEARCIEADVVPSDHPDKKDPMSIGITVVGEGAFSIRECPKTVGYGCHADAFETDRTTMASCDIELDESGVKKPGFQLETWQDIGDVALRMRIAL